MTIQTRNGRRVAAKKRNEKTFSDKLGTGREKRVLQAKMRERRIGCEDERNLRVAAERAGLKNDLLRKCRFETRTIDSLRPSKHRVHKKDAAHLLDMMESIERNGFLDPVLVTGDMIIDGHTRVEALLKLGITEVECLVVDDCDEADIARIALGFQALAKQAEFDIDTLKVLVCDVIPVEDLDYTYLGDEVLDVLLTADEEIGAADENIPEPSRDPVTKLGDLWLLGDHRVLCASATKRESYAELVRDEPVAAVITDCPYNVRIKGNVSGLGSTKHGEFVEGSGEKTPEEFLDFTRTWMDLSARCCIEGAPVATFIDWRSIDVIMTAGKELGLTLLNIAVWDKQSGGMGSYLRSAHEFFPIFCTGGRLATNNVQLGRHGRMRTNVWKYPGASQRGSSAAAALKDHPTPKNLEMIVDAILDVTHRGDLVLDPFLGSGTTLIAAQKSLRHCYGFELDPAYVDVVVKGWQDLTGEVAINAETGLSFAETETARKAELSPDQVTLIANIGTRHEQA